MYKDLIKEKVLHSLQMPPTIVPNPESNDYENGFIERYFVQKVNDKTAQVFEISNSTYPKYISNPYWATVNIKWRITGPVDTIYNETGDIADRGVINSNKMLLDIAAEKIKNIKLYLPNLLQFHRK